MEYGELPASLHLIATISRGNEQIPDSMLQLLEGKNVEPRSLLFCVAAECL
jgi:hypothetical protein